jgi:hypothetical protein
MLLLWRGVLVLLFRTPIAKLKELILGHPRALLLQRKTFTDGPKARYPGLILALLIKVDHQIAVELLGCLWGPLFHAHTHHVV